MPYFKANDTGSLNRWRANVSAAGKRQAEMRTCPACKRGNALGRPVFFDGGWVRRCRYCQHEKARRAE